jgi:multidrug efflux pump subunit AcrA (membrane-fusion protein)
MNQLYIAFNAAIPNIRPGMNVSTSITVEKADVLAVPRRCIGNTNGDTTVAVLRGDQYETVPVTIGIVSGNLIEIKEGLIAGETVLAE